MNPWTLAALAALGIVLFGVEGKSGSTTESVNDSSPTSDAEIAAVADYALLHETDVTTLRDLARYMRVLPMGTQQDATAWNRRRSLLAAKADAIVSSQQSVHVDSAATMTFRKMTGG